MAMSLPLSPLSSVSDIQSPALGNTTNDNNTNGSNNNGQDQTTPTPTTSTTTTLSSTTPMRRKPSRRANTAERRATHNAVERQRRETLNGRFLVSHQYSFFFFFPPTNNNFSRSPPGLSFPTPKPLSNQTSLQIIHRQFINSLHPRFPSSPSLGIS